MSWSRITTSTFSSGTTTATGPSPDGTPSLSADQKKIYVAYVHNLYAILDRLRAKHPKLEIESCSGGGGRVDLGILRRTEEVWPSDNTDALDRLSIQDGFTHAYTPGVMMAWVTDAPHRKTPLKFRFLVAMEGSLGIGANLNNFTPEDMATAKDLVAFYKTIRPTVQQGSQYRLIAPSRPGAPSERAATEYVSADGTQAVVLAYLHSQNFGDPYPLVRLTWPRPESHLPSAPARSKATPLPAGSQRQLLDEPRPPARTARRLRQHGRRAGAPERHKIIGTDKQREKKNGR